MRLRDCFASHEMRPEAIFPGWYPKAQTLKYGELKSDVEVASAEVK